jgi:hypothetical protein
LEKICLEKKKRKEKQTFGQLVVAYRYAGIYYYDYSKITRQVIH